MLLSAWVIVISLTIILAFIIHLIMVPLLIFVGIFAFGIGIVGGIINWMISIAIAFVIVYFSVKKIYGAKD